MSLLPHISAEIVMRRVADLVPYARNARTHSPRQVDQIAASILQFGFTNPILIDPADMIIAGHGRVLGADKLKLVQVPCIVLAHLSEAEKRAYIIADNKLALNAGWDEQLLRAELEDLRLDGFDIGLTGFSMDEFRGLDHGLGEGGDAPTSVTPESWVVIVTCASEADQVELIQQLQAEGRSVRGAVA